MAFVDSTVVNVALPVMQKELGASVDAMQWVVEAYALFLASLVLVGGALGDRFGRRRVFTCGVVLFAFASAACGLAPSAQLLVIARGAQGVGGALLVPGSLALISAAFSEHDRGGAIGTWSAASAVTAAIGPVLGGWVVGHASWRWIFLLNLPIGAVTVIIALRRVEETRDETAPRRLDGVGAALAIAGLGAIVYALLDAANAGGLGAPRIVAALVAGVATLGAFVAFEARHPAPMVPLGLFRSRTFAGANVLTLLLYAALGGGLFFVPFNLIQVQGYSPAAAGAAFLPFIVLISAMSRWAGGLADRHGVRGPLTVGPLVAAAGFALLAMPGRGGSYLGTFFPGVVVLGLGMGTTVAPLTTAVMGSVDAHHAGVASGINNAVARAAGLLAVAALGVILLARFGVALDTRLSTLGLDPETARAVSQERLKLAGADFAFVVDPALRAAIKEAFAASYVDGFRAVMFVNVVLAALGGVGAYVVLPPTRPGAPRIPAR
jgi:EmrB/QacA subfamily drug resistance transporter